MKPSAEEFESDDGVDDHDEENEQGDVQQRKHRLDDGVQHHLKTCDKHVRVGKERKGKTIYIAPLYYE